MDDRFAQAVAVHRILGDPAESIAAAEPSDYQRRLVRRLVERAHGVSRSLIDRAILAPEPVDALDESLDQQLLSPARRAIVQRTVSLERWLADHGFRGGRPIRFVRSHRSLGYHGESLNLPTARPVFRDDFSPADESLTDRILDGINEPTAGLGGLRRRPTNQPAGRISVVPGFIVLELSPDEFAHRFGVEPTSQVLPAGRQGNRAIDTSEVGSGRSASHGHVAIGSVAAGPVLVATRDHRGARLAHALLREYAHELTHLGTYQHRHSLAAPGQLIQSPHHYHAVADSFGDVTELDQLAHQLLAERSRHLPHDCQLGLTHIREHTGSEGGNDTPGVKEDLRHSYQLQRSAPTVAKEGEHWPLTLGDLGFTASDWVPLAEPYPLDGRFVAVARTYLASLLLGRTLISALNYHPEAVPLAPYFPRHAFADVTCHDDWHPHYAAAHQYRNFIQAAEAGQLGAAALDDLYARLIDPAIDGLDDHVHHPAIRLHTYSAPLHASEQ